MCRDAAATPLPGHTPLSTLGHRRSALLLYSDAESVDSHRVRLVLAEKAINAEIQACDPDDPPAELAHLNPQNGLPTLVDRELVLYDARVIIDYLDERYPHPPFLPVDPISRARTRLALYRIESDWYSLLYQLTDAPESRQQFGLRLAESLAASADVFKAMPYFLSNEYSILDATLAPLLWRLRWLGVQLPDTAKPVSDYAQRVFYRDGFQASLTPQEREMGA